MVSTLVGVAVLPGFRSPQVRSYISTPGCCFLRFGRLRARFA